MPLKTAFYNPSVENVELVEGYLNSLSGKAMSLRQIRQNIFKKKWTRDQIDLLYRCEFQAAAIFLKYLQEKSSEVSWKANVQTTIADLTQYVRFFDSEVDTSFIVVSPNTDSSQVHFKNATSLFYQCKLPDKLIKRYHQDVLVLYALRLSMERRVLNFLGIDYLESSKGIIGLMSLLRIAKKLKNIEYHPGIKWEEIDWVLYWLNHLMHRGVRPHPWTIHQAIEVLNPLFNPGKKVSGKRISWSIYASTYVEDEEMFHNELVQALIRSGQM